METVALKEPTKPRQSTVFFNAAENRLRGGWRLLIQGLLYMGGTLIAQILLGAGLGVYLASTGADFTDPNLITQLIENPLFRLILALISLVFIFATCWFAAWKLDKRPFRDYGLHINRLWWADMGFGLFLGAFLMLLIFLVERAAGWITVRSAVLDGSAWSAIAVYLVIFICVGIYEEMLSRGYQTRNLAESFNHPRIGSRLAILLAVLGTSTFFGLLHAANPNATLTSTFYLVVAGLFFGVIYMLTGELAMPMGLHITWNFFQGIVFGFPVSGQGSPASFFQIEQGGPLAWTGGAFGPEAGFIGLAAILLGVAMVVAWVRLTRGKVALVHELAEYRKDLA